MHKGEQPLKEQNKACFFACATLRHPFLLRNSLIFNMRYSMAQKSDEVRKNNEGGCTSLMRPPSSWVLRMVVVCCALCHSLLNAVYNIVHIIIGNYIALSFVQLWSARTCFWRCRTNNSAVSDKRCTIICAVICTFATNNGSYGKFDK
ncbi:unknown [Prevotella sp. CAG:5226]|nr:unknown [Prevotella sp. CAG:5226]